jgi:hypothetical protein
MRGSSGHDVVAARLELFRSLMASKRFTPPFLGAGIDCIGHRVWKPHTAYGVTASGRPAPALTPRASISDFRLSFGEPA